MREPCFENLLQVLRREVPDRPTLFELFLNGPLYERLVGPDKAAEIAATTDGLAAFRLMMHGYCAAGYDYSTIHGSDFHFRLGEVHMKKTRSLNEGALISDRATFESYPWPDPDTFDYSRLETLASELPEGMKFIVMGPGGVLENVIQQSQTMTGDSRHRLCSLSKTCADTCNLRQDGVTLTALTSPVAPLPAALCLQCHRLFPHSSFCIPLQSIRLQDSKRGKMEIDQSFLSHPTHLSRQSRAGHV